MILNLRKFKINASPDSGKVNTLKAGDVVIRQYADNQSTKRTVMLVSEAGNNKVIENGIEKIYPYFIASLLSGDEPKPNEVLDFVRLTSLFDNDRLGSIYLTGDDDGSPYIDVMDGFFQNAVFRPTHVGENGYKSKSPNVLVFNTDGFGASFVNNGEKNGVSMDHNGLMDNNGSWMVSFQIKTSKNADVRLTIDSDADTVIKSTTEYQNVSYVVTSNKMGIQTRNISLLAQSLTLNGDKIEIRNFSVIKVSDLLNASGDTKARIGKLSGVTDEVFGELDGYGVYTQNLYAINANVSGTITAGGKDGEGSSFYAGRIHTNMFINSLSMPTYSGVGTPIDLGKDGKVLKLSSDSIKLLVQTKGWIKKNINKQTIFSIFCKTELASSVIKIEDSFGNKIEQNLSSIDGFVRVKLPIIVKKLDSDLFVTISGKGNIVFAPQYEYGLDVSLYQPTDSSLAYEEHNYGMWASKGGFGGTIQNPLLKLNADGKGAIESKDSGFKLNADGSGHLGGGAISFSKDKVNISLSGTNMGAEVDSINSEIDKAKADAKNANDKIDGLQIGGRNYFAFYKMSSYAPYNSLPTLIDGTKIRTVFNNGKFFTIGSEAWTKYNMIEDGIFIFSGYITINGEIPLNNPFKNNFNTYYSYHKDSVYDSKSGFLCMWSKVTKSNPRQWVMHASVDSLKTGDIIIIDKPQLERATKVSDWSPAPEDQQTELKKLDTSIRTDFDVIEGQINANVAKTETLVNQTTGLVEESKQTATQVTQTAEEVKTTAKKVQENADKVASDTTTVTQNANEVKINAEQVRVDKDSVTAMKSSIEVTAEGINTKAQQVDKAQTEINQTAEQIKSTASRIDGQETSINQTADKVASDAKDVAGNKTSVEQTANEVKQVAKDVEGKQTEINQTAEEINLKAVEVNTNATEAKKQAVIADTKAKEAAEASSLANEKAEEANEKALEANKKAEEALASSGASSEAYQNAKLEAEKANKEAIKANTEATKATTQAGKATTEANRAKTEADKALASQKDVTLKQTEINQTASEIKLSAKEVSDNTAKATEASATATKKATEATSQAELAQAQATEATAKALEADKKAQEALASAGSSSTSYQNAKKEADKAKIDATTANTKALEAKKEADRSKVEADKALASQKVVTEKEASINVTAGNIELKATEVTKNAETATAQAELATKKATEATTASTNATKKATEADLKAKEADAKAKEALASAGSSSESYKSAKLEAEKANTEATKAKAEATKATTEATKAKLEADKAALIEANVTAKETSINQTAEQVKIDAKSAKESADRAVTAESSIDLKAEGIVMQASEQSAKKAIDELEIGGRNYVSISELEDGTINSESGLGVSWNNQSRKRSVNFIQTHGASICGCTRNNRFGIFYFFYNQDKETIAKAFYDSGLTSAYHIVNIPESASFFKYVIQSDLSDGFTINDLLNEKIKIEFGNKPTDWSPAPEDTETKITENSSKLEVLSTQISTKVEKKEYDENKTAVNSSISKVDQKADSINSTVSSNKKDADGKITALDTRVTQTEKDITQRVSKTEYDANNKVVEQKFSEVNQSVDGVTIKIESANSEIDKAKNDAKVANDKIDGLEIGGVNKVYKQILRHNTSNANVSFNKWLPEGTIFYNNVRGTMGVYLEESELDVHLGDKAVMSFKYRITDGIVDAFGGHCEALFQSNVVYLDGVKQPNPFNVPFPIPQDKEWHEIVVYFDLRITSVARNQAVYIQPNRLSKSIGSVELCNLQLEIGNKKTPFSLSYRDQQAELNKLKTETSTKLEILDGKISTKVEQKTYDSNNVIINQKISSVDQKADGISAIVASNKVEADGKIQTNTSNISLLDDKLVTEIKKTDGTQAQVTQMEIDYNKFSVKVYEDIDGAIDDNNEVIKSSFTMNGNKIGLLGSEIDITGKVTFSALDSETQEALYVTAAKVDGLGDLAYEDMVSIAKLDNTIIDGGHIISNLISADTFVGRELIVDMGKVGNWIIKENSIENTNIILEANGGIKAKSNKWMLNPDGSVKFESGDVGGWKINSSTLSSKDSKLVLDPSGAIKSTSGFWSLGSDGVVTMGENNDLSVVDGKVTIGSFVAQNGTLISTHEIPNNSGSSSMALSGKTIVFRDDINKNDAEDQFISIGSNAISPISGMSGNLLINSTTRNLHNHSDFGAVIQITSSYAKYDTSGTPLLNQSTGLWLNMVTQNSVGRVVQAPNSVSALRLSGGNISGFGLTTKMWVNGDNNKMIEDTDSFIIVHGNTHRDFYIPHPKDTWVGRVIMMYNRGAKWLRANIDPNNTNPIGNGAFVFGKDSARKQWSINDGQIGFMINDGQYWNCGYMDWSSSQW